MLDQNQIPLLKALKDVADRPHAAFYTPGHRRGQGIPEPLAAVLGSEVFRADVPELPELDNLFAPEGAILRAQELAAEAFGADRTRFLVNGSTAGIVAAILATCDPGDQILVPRTVHRSVISGLVMSGAIAVFVNPEIDPDWNIPLSLTPEAIASTLQRHPDIKAVLAVHPTYRGICGDLEKIVDIVNSHNIPLLVDEAHGGHFGFHPDLPISALAAGADLTVQSTHKVLGAMNQASMLHIKGDRIDISRLDRALEMLQSTSPSYLLLASLDAARHQMATQGKKRIDQALKLAGRARNRLHQLPLLRVYDAAPRPGCLARDRTRLTVDVAGLGLSGYEADEILHRQFRVTAELPDFQNLTFIVSPANTQQDIDDMAAGFAGLIRRAEELGRDSCRFPRTDLPTPPASVPALSPRDAYFAETAQLPIGECRGRIGAECICPYPPGIPVLWPGEVISEEAIAFLRQVRALGGQIVGCGDPSLETLRVVV